MSNDSVNYSVDAFWQKTVQRGQNAAAGFVLNRFFSTETQRDGLSLGWILTLENTQFNILKPKPKPNLRHRALLVKLSQILATAQGESPTYTPLQ